MFFSIPCNLFPACRRPTYSHKSNCTICTILNYLKISVFGHSYWLPVHFLTNNSPALAREMSQFWKFLEITQYIMNTVYLYKILLSLIWEYIDSYKTVSRSLDNNVRNYEALSMINPLLFLSYLGTKISNN